MKTVDVSYFAVLREQRGLAGERVTTTARTPRELYDELQRHHGLTLEADCLKVALNQEFRDMDSLLKDGDEVVFLPPVAGG